MAEQTNKKLNKSLFIIITSFIMVFLFVCGFAITYAFYGGSSRQELGNIVLANLDIDVTYKLEFDDVLLPNTKYTGDNYSLFITNSGNSGPIYLRVKVESSHPECIELMLASESLWAVGGADNNEYYYLSTLNLGSTQSFLSGFKTLNNFTNEIAGDTFTINFTVYAIQSQYGAVKEDSSWTANAPEEFKTFIDL